MKEIGGYFELDWFKNNPYHKNMIELNTGRNALIYLIKAKKIKKIYIPYYLCDSVSDILKRYSVEFEYYYIDKRFMPLLYKELNDNEYIYLVNYYGQICNERVILLKEKFNQIILDNTQSFYQLPVVGVDTIYSCRKFFGVPDGAYLYTDIKLNYKLETDISMNRMNHILGRFEGIASDYFDDFKKNDESFKTAELKEMSNLTKNLLGTIDYEKIRQIRNTNFGYLNNNLKATNKLELVVSDGPFSFPYYIENGFKMKKELVKDNIYIPTLWPNVIENVSNKHIEYEYVANILPLPCDQRYSIKHMKYIIEVIKNV